MEDLFAVATVVGFALMLIGIAAAIVMYIWERTR